MTGVNANLILYSGQQGRENLYRGAFNYSKSLDRNNNNLLSAGELKALPVLGTRLEASGQLDSFARSLAPLDGEAGVSLYDLSIALFHAEVQEGNLDGVIEEKELNLNFKAA